MNWKSSRQLILFASTLTALVPVLSVCDQTVIGGAPDRYVPVSNFQTVQTVVRDDQRLAGQGKLGQTVILQNSADLHGESLQNGTRVTSKTASTINIKSGDGLNNQPATAADAGVPAVSSTNIVNNIRYAGTTDTDYAHYGDSFFELYGNFTDPSSLVVSCDEVGSIDPSVTYFSANQVNIRLPKTLEGKTCTVSGKGQTNPQIISVPKLADQHAVFYLTGTLTNNAGTIIPNETIQIKYYDNQNNPVLATATVDVSGHYVLAVDGFFPSSLSQLDLEIAYSGTSRSYYGSLPFSSIPSALTTQMSSGQGVFVNIGTLLKYTPPVNTIPGEH